MRRATTIPPIPSLIRWNQALVSNSPARAINPRRYTRILPTRTRPSLFGSD
jgi:hypothetical protein